MAETPDFDQIARETIVRARSEQHLTGLEDDAVAIVAEYLRLLWNARGAEVAEARADAEKLHRLWVEARGQIERLETDRDLWKANYEKVVALLDEVPPGT